MAIGAVTDTGPSIVYEPEDPSSAIVDIVFVHGLQGHPRGTWTKGKAPKSRRSPHPFSGTKTSEPLDEEKAKRGSLSWTRISRKLKRKSLAPQRDGADDTRFSQESSGPAVIPSLDTSSRNTTNVSTATASGRNGGVFWPADLLPQACPRARILVFGYDTKITNYGVASTNKNSIYSHAKDLLFALSRETEGCVGPAGRQRQIVFVAHSLGGIVVKEMLSRSSTSTEPRHSRIVESTAGVVFLGTPHRGSPDFAAAGDWARTFVSFFGAETSPAILHALGLRTTDLERAQESFSGLWLKHNFRVKTFQEGLGFTGINFGALGGKVVPDYSSSLGDQREHAETIQANHREMCRFYGTDDPGYRKVSGELLSIYLTIEKHISTPLRCAATPTFGSPPSQASSPKGKKASVKSSVPFSVNSFDLWGMDKVPFTEAEKAFLTSLWYPNMNSRRRMVTTPADGTCNWLFQRQAYIQWIKGHHQDAHNGLLQIKGTPGSGKSVLVKEAYSRALQKYAGSGCYIAAYFFYENGASPLEKSKQGLLRSLLYQLLPQDRECLAKATKEFTAWSSGILNQAPREDVVFPAEQLEKTLRSFLMKSSRQRHERRTLIFIDALDECSSLEDRMSLSYFLGATSVQATKSKVKLNILMSNRNFPFLTVGSQPAQLDMNQLNRGDVRRYVEQRLALGITATESERSQILDAVLAKARGVFLWVVLAVNGIIERWQQGQSLLELLRHLDVLPLELRNLYQDLLKSVPAETRKVTLRLFQWAVFATRPLQLREWHDLMACISRTTAPKSLKECQESVEFTTTDDQLERKVRTLSKGLLEVAVDTEEPENDSMARSVSQFAGAGSFMMNPGETKVIQVIHETVDHYFWSGGGFAQLGCSEIEGARKAKVLSHLAILRTCLEYLGISELDALVRARIKAAKRERLKALWKNSALKQKLGGTNVGKDGVFNENEYQSPIGPEGVDVLRWLAGIAPLDHGIDVTGHDQGGDLPAEVKRLSQSSDYSVRTQRLEAHTALLYYITDEFFVHAGCCFDEWDSDFYGLLQGAIRTGMKPIMSQLLNKDFFRRWLALREELHVIYPVDGTSPLSPAHYLFKVDRRFRFVLPPEQVPSPADVRSGIHGNGKSAKKKKSGKPKPSPPSSDEGEIEQLENLAIAMPPGADSYANYVSYLYKEKTENTTQEKKPYPLEQPEESGPGSYGSYSDPADACTSPAAGGNGPRKQSSVGSFRSAASGGSRHSRHSYRGVAVP